MTEFWEKTIQLFNNFIDYPQLTEKYLKRPPFKYIFQIFLSLNTKTGFANDSFKEEELDPEFYDTPEKKMAFLKQIIKIVYSPNSKICPLKPQSVIKGVECDKTNEFLQDMYQIASSFNPKKKQTIQDEKLTKSPQNLKKEVQAKTNTNSIPVEISKNGLDRTQNQAIVKNSDNNKKEVHHESVNKTTKEKENLKEKTLPDNSGKLAQQLLENASKEEKLVTKTRVNSGSQNETGIKMGKLNSGSIQGSQNVSNIHENDNKEVNYEEIKAILQKLTQNTNPLGKLVEFVDDDLDAMNKECKKWLKMFSETGEKLQKIEEVQNDELQNYHFTLNEINEQIFDYENKILSVRSRIQRNNAKIDTMLSKVVG